MQYLLIAGPLPQETAGRYGFPRICLPFERVAMSLFV